MAYFDILTLTIAGTVRNLWLQPGLTISREISQATASFTLNDRTGGPYRPSIGDDVLIDSVPFITINGERIRVDEPPIRLFGGRIVEISERDEDTCSTLWFDVRCQDYSECMNRRLVTTAHENMAVGDMVKAIVTTYLSGEGITTTGVVDGPTITDQQVFDFCTVREAIDRLAQIVGYDWYVDGTKDLCFAPLSSNPARFTVSDESHTWLRMRVSRSTTDYRNVQTVRTNSGISGQTSATATVEEPDEITAHGRYERVDDISNVQLVNSAEDIADGLLSRYGTIPTVIEFETPIDTLYTPGATVTVNTTRPLVNGKFLIESVTSTEEGMQIFRHRVRAVSGYALGNWKTWFANLSQRARNAQPVGNFVYISLAWTNAADADIGHGIVRSDGWSTRLVTTVTEAPVGGPITLAASRIAQGGGSANIVANDGSITIPEGFTGAVETDVDPDVGLSAGDRIQIDATAVGSDTPGTVSAVQVEVHPHQLTLQPAHFNLGIDVGDGPAPIYVGTGVTNPVPVDIAGTPVWAEAILTEAPVGADAIFDIKRTTSLGVTESVFGSGAKPTIPAGSTALHKTFEFPADFTLSKGDILTCDVTQVGSTTPGSGGLVRLLWRPKN